MCTVCIDVMYTIVVAMNDVIVMLYQPAKDIGMFGFIQTIEVRFIPTV